MALDDRGTFVAVRRMSQSFDRGNNTACHTTSEVVAGSAAWLGKGLSCVCAQRRESDARPSFDLTPSQEDSLQRLQNRLDVQYDSSNPEHQEALKALWNAAFPEEELNGLISEQWKEMGWQGKDPSTDFRGGGFISLENLLYFARNFPKMNQPFGVSLLLAGFDDKGPQLYQVDPSGSYFSWKDSAMGKNVSNAKTFLEKRFEGQISGKNIEIGIFRNDKKFSNEGP